MCASHLSSTPAAETQVDHQEPQEDVFTLVSWNLECLDQAMLTERTEVFFLCDYRRAL